MTVFDRMLVGAGIAVFMFGLDIAFGRGVMLMGVGVFLFLFGITKP